MIYFLTYFPYFFLNNDDQYGAMTLAQKVMACLFGNVAMAFGVKTVAAYEGTGMFYFCGYETIIPKKILGFS